MEKSRIDKFVSGQLNLPRSTVKEQIKKGLVTVNGKIIKDCGFSVDMKNDTVKYNNETVNYKEHIYIVMNKPSGILSASNDKTRETVVDIVPENMKRQGLFPVGRLDKDTTGLLIITDDGVFAHNCIAPKKGIAKRYIAELDGNITKEMCEAFKKGVVLADNTVCKPAELTGIGENTASIVITEGKYHQIKRMFGTVGLGVNKLHRESLGGLRLPEGLESGECVEMSEQDIKNAIYSSTCTFLTK